jgi:hypothetical protein
MFWREGKKNIMGGKEKKKRRKKRKNLNSASHGSAKRE